MVTNSLTSNMAAIRWKVPLLVLLYLHLSCSVFVPDQMWTQSCYKGCICDPAAKSVHCIGLQFVNASLLLESIPEDAQEIIIEKCQIKNNLDINLQNWPRVTVLSLQDNELMGLKLNSDYQPHYLETLLLDGNKLNNLDFLEHSQLSRLRSLNVSNNNLKNLAPKSLQHLSGLTTLHLGMNQIERFPYGFFNKTTHLKELYIERNKIDFIHPSTFRNLYLLERLHLHGNSLTTLINGTFDELSELNDLRLDDNPFDCNCALKWLVVDMLGAGQTKYSRNELTKCASPSIYSMVPLYKLQQGDLFCFKPKIRVTSGDTTIYYLHDTVLWCNTSGYPRPSVYWVTPRGQILAHKHHHVWIDNDIHNKLRGVSTFKAQPTHYESKATALRDGSLHIERMRNYFAGQYLCIAENPAGVVSMNITLKMTTLMPYTFLSTLWVGGSAAGGFLLFGIVFGLLRWCVESLVSMKRKKKLNMNVNSDVSVYSDSIHSQYYYDSPGPSPGPSPMKCTTPVSMEDGEYDDSHVTFPNIKETLEDVRIRLRSGMEKQVGRIRSRAQHVRQAGSQYVQTFKDSSSHYMQTIKESSSQYANNLRSSTGQYAQRVRVGVQLGVEQVKYHVQSMKELCGTGDINQTVSTVSISTDVDTQERTEVIKSITIV